MKHPSGIRIYRFSTRTLPTTNKVPTNKKIVCSFLDIRRVIDTLGSAVRLRVAATLKGRTNLPEDRMRVLDLFCGAAATLLVHVTLLMPWQVHGFAPARSNMTKSNPFMMPLEVDYLLSAKRIIPDDGSDDHSLHSPSLPRGIVLNTGVGGLAFAGGLMGYVKKGSKASLIAGSIFCSLLMVSAFLIRLASGAKATSTNKQLSRKGNILGFATSGLLTYAMGKKFMKSGTFVPAGIIAVGAAVSFIYNAIEVVLVTTQKNSDTQSDTPAEVKESEVAE